MSYVFDPVAHEATLIPETGLRVFAERALDKTTNVARAVFGYINQNDLARVIHGVFTRPAVNENPLRTKVTNTEGDEYRDTVQIPQFLLDFDLKGPNTEENTFRMTPPDTDADTNTKRVHWASESIAQLSGYNTVEEYLAALEQLYVENEAELEPFFLAAFEQRKKLLNRGKVADPDGVFLVHVGTPGQAVKYAREIKYPLAKMRKAGVDYLFRALLRTPAFLMKREAYVLENDQRLSIETIHAGLIPAEMEKSTTELALEGLSGPRTAKYAAREGLLYSVLLRGAAVVGLGGLMGKMTKSGIAAQQVVDLAKVAYLKLAQKGLINLGELDKYLPNILRATVTTGHRGTLDAMVQHFEAYLQYAKKENAVVAVYGGAGLIGSSFASLMEGTKCRQIYLVDPVFAKSPQRAHELIAELAANGVQAICVTPDEFIKNKTASSIDVMAVATESNGKFYDDDTVVPGFRENVLEALPEHACIIDDNHPYCISPNAVRKLQERGVLYTGVGVAFRAKSIRKVRGRSYNLDKPVANESLEVAYGCKAEMMWVARALREGILRHGFIGKASPQGVADLRNVAQKLKTTPRVVFHNKEEILPLRAA